MAHQKLTFSFEITIVGALEIIGLPTKPDGTFVFPQAVVGQPYSLQLSAKGGTPPYTWQVTGLPPGLTCAASGLVSGTPTAEGVFSKTDGGVIDDSGV